MSACIWVAKRCQRVSKHLRKFADTYGKIYGIVTQKEKEDFSLLEPADVIAFVNEQRKHARKHIDPIFGPQPIDVDLGDGGDIGRSFMDKGVKNLNEQELLDLFFELHPDQLKRLQGKPPTIENFKEADINSHLLMDNPTAQIMAESFTERLLEEVAYKPQRHEKGANIKPVYLSIQNPLIIQYKDVKGKFGRVVQQAKKDGYDGVIVRDMHDMGRVADQYVVFDSTQVKSEFNKGTWDSTKKDIRASSMTKAELEGFLQDNGFSIKSMVDLDPDLAKVPDEIVPEVFVDRARKAIYLADDVGKKPLEMAAVDFIVGLAQVHEPTLNSIKAELEKNFMSWDINTRREVVEALTAGLDKYQGGLSFTKKGKKTNVVKNIVGIIKKFLKGFGSLFYETLDLKPYQNQFDETVLGGIINAKSFGQTMNNWVAGHIKPSDLIPIGHTQQSLQKLTRERPGTSDVIATLQKALPSSALTGSPAIAEQGTIYRRGGEGLHDIDIVMHGMAEMGQDEVIRRLKEHFGQGNVTKTRGDVEGKQIAVDITFSNNSTGGTDNINVDIFDNTETPYNSLTFINERGEDVKINTVDYSHPFQAKLGYGRFKDIVDYANFVPFEKVTRIRPSKWKTESGGKGTVHAKSLMKGEFALTDELEDERNGHYINHNEGLLDTEKVDIPEHELPEVLNPNRYNWPTDEKFEQSYEEHIYGMRRIVEKSGLFGGNTVRWQFYKRAIVEDPVANMESPMMPEESQYQVSDITEVDKNSVPKILHPLANTGVGEVISMEWIDKEDEGWWQDPVSVTVKKIVRKASNQWAVTVSNGNKEYTLQVDRNGNTSGGHKMGFRWYADEIETREARQERLSKPVFVPLHGKDNLMTFEMSAENNNTGKKTTTVAEAEAGRRTSTTRSKPLGKVGDVITFNKRPQHYRITSVYQIKKGDLQNPAALKKLSKMEGWTEKAIMNDMSRYFVVGNWITQYERIETPRLKTDTVDPMEAARKLQDSPHYEEYMELFKEGFEDVSAPGTNVRTNKKERLFSKQGDRAQEGIKPTPIEPAGKLQPGHRPALRVNLQKRDAKVVPILNAVTRT
jgi:hypothetical protein